MVQSVVQKSVVQSVVQSVPYNTDDMSRTTQALAVWKLLMVTITADPQVAPLPPLPTVRDIAEGPINQLPATAGQTSQ